jgi:hypothetical protein
MEINFLLQLQKVLQDSYKFLQTFAVGLEQVVWDQDEGSGYKSDFQATEYSLRSVSFLTFSKIQYPNRKSRGFANEIFVTIGSKMMLEILSKCDFKAINNSVLSKLI